MNNTFLGVFQRPHLPTLIEAVYASMKVVQGWQWVSCNGVDKTNGTIVTQTDRDSEEVALAILKDTGLDIWPEEAGFVGEFKTDQVILYDPLDGTAPFTNGAMSSTVSAAIYCLGRKRVIACVVGEPASRRIWVSSEGLGVWRFQVPVEGPLAFREFTVNDSFVEQMNVWTGPLSTKSTVYLDLYPTFKNPGFPTVPDEVWGKFFPQVFALSRVNMFGTNCGHHAIIANGSEGAVGAITTALGGPWDVTPVQLVIEAGGAARAFSTKDSVLVEVDALQVLDYNLLVTGNTPDTVYQLSELLVAHLRTHHIV
jgi:Inositol monophosphatase family